MRHQRTKLSSAAFTLVELLVVIAVVAILASLLLPALATGKARARSVECLNNLKQWNLALAMYAEETEIMPREGYLTNGRVRADLWANVRDPLSRDAWYNALPPYLSERPARAYFSAITGERARFYERRIFHCPSAKFPAGVAMDNQAFFSLAMNSKLIQPGVSPGGTISFSAIEHPSRTALFLDARVSFGEGKVDPLQWDIDLGQPSIFASRFSNRHRKGGNLAFADGSASWRNGASVVETRAGRARGFAVFPDGDILWCLDPLTDPNGVE